jgi:hypothetical protein
MTTKKILIVDDEDGLRQIIQYMVLIFSIIKGKLISAPERSLTEAYINPI